MEFNATLIGQMITFALLIVCTMKYVWPPILRAMQERTEKIADGLAAAEQGKQALSDAGQQVEEILADGRAKVSEMMDQANKRSAALIEEARQQAKDESTQIRRQAEEDVNRLLEAGRLKLKNETVDLALAIATRIIGQQMNEAANSNFVEQILQEVEEK